MTQVCSHCSRRNPDAASFCYFDGSALPGHVVNGGPIPTGSQRFHSQFVFPSGRACSSFDELALSCQENWPEARDLLQKGYLENFLSSLGRADLAVAARDAAHFPDPERGLDQFLAKLPTRALDAPKLKVEPVEVNLGQLRPGEDQQFELDLHNQGMRLLYGSVACEPCDWLSLGPSPGVRQKLFEFRNELTIPVHVWGKRLRAGSQPLEARFTVESNGGTATVLIRAQVPARPFPEGVLAGAVTPRQVAEKAKAATQEAAIFFENGAVARWYQENGWTYPILGPPASGLGALQQFFEALGLTPAPKVDISERAVTLEGVPGEKLEHMLEVKAQEKRPVYAHGVSDSAWLEVGRARRHGRRAYVPLVVPSVPPRPGETLHGRVTVTSNGNQQFAVEVSLAVGRGARRAEAKGETHSGGSGGPGDSQRTPAAVAARSRPSWMQLVTGVLFVLVLLGVVLRDLAKISIATPPAVEEADLIDPEPRLAIQFHDGKKGDEVDRLMPEATMRFGLMMLKEKDGPRPKRLTYDDWGRSNDTCVRLDGKDLHFGHAPGRWKERAAELGTDRAGRKRDGLKSVWLEPDKHLQVSQFVEIVPGEQSRLLDTCLVRYMIENQDQAAHQVGLRFLLDTFIGSNDGVPFTIPGARGLCDTFKVFNTPAEIPDFIQAFEKETLEHPGTIARVQLKAGGRVEPPGRVTLGAWPDLALPQKPGEPAPLAQMTGWQVPVFPIKTIPPGDSAVVMYWDERTLQPAQSREVGFAYGLASLASGEGKGRLALTVGGSFVPGGQFTLTAYVQNPEAGETLTLTMPDGLQLTEGKPVEPVPAVTANAASRTSPVTWKVRANQTGEFTLKVQSSKGVAQAQTVSIRSRGIFD